VAVISTEEGLSDKINEALKEEELEYKGGIKVRHLLDVLSRDFDPENIKPLVKQDMSGLKVAPYYGCQALRPYPDFDDPQEPRSMEPVIVDRGEQMLWCGAHEHQKGHGPGAYGWDP
jgi:heterodisulfide reductase subunit B